MPSERGCPDRETLTALLLGKLPSERADEVNLHLESCPACEESAQQLEVQTDPLIEALRQPSSTGLAPEVTQRTPGTQAAPAPFQLEGFQLLGEVGRGGMGVVYRAHQHRLNRVVAIKMILTGQLAGPEDRVRFLMEGALLARLNHPNFVQVHEVGTLALSPELAQPYLVLEHVEGGSLKARLAQGALPVREAAQLVLVLARAMEAAHAQGIIHRDLKPANVLFSRDGTPKITDFGLAKELGSGASLTPTGLAVGTPAYMAPEQARGGIVGPAADVYALGAILYEMLAGQPPFQGVTAMEVILQVMDRPAPSMARLRPGIPRDLETICRKCLEKEPRARYARAADLAEDLQRWLDGRPIQARPAGRVERAVKWARRHPLPASLIVLLVASLLAGSAASTYFGLAALERAQETEKALALEEVARQASDRRAVELQIVAGQRLADAGEVDHGLLLLTQALARTPAKEEDLQRVLQLNLETWLPYLPRLRWYRDSPPVGNTLVVDKEVVCWRDNKLWTLDAETGETRQALREFPGKWIVACGPRGGRIGTVRDEKDGVAFQVFERTTGQPVGSALVVRHGSVVPGNGPYSLQFSADETLLACEAHGVERWGRLVWDLASGKEIGAPIVRAGVVAAHLLQTPGGGCYWLLLRAGGAGELVDARSGASLGAELERWPADLERRPSLFPARSLVQQQRYNLEVTLWDLERAAAVLPPWRLPWSGLDHHVSADGRHLVETLSDQRICWHDLASHQPYLPTAGVGRGTIGGGDHVRSVPPGPSCLVASRFRPILKRFDFPRLLATRGGGESRLPGADPWRGLFGNAAFSPDRQVVVLGDVARNHRQAYARLVATADNEPIGLPLTDCDMHATFSPSGRLVALASWHNPRAGPGELVVRVYDARTGVPRSPAWPMIRYIHTLAFSPDERLLAVGHVAGAALCNLESGAAPIELKQPGPVERLQFSRDGRRLALCMRAGWQGGEPGVRIWDVATAQPAGQLVPMSQVPFVLPTEQGDGFLTIECERGRMRHWDFSAAAPTADLDVLPDWPGANLGSPVAFDKVRRRLALGTAHGAIYQWDLRTRQRFGVSADLLRAVHVVAYAPNGRWLVATGDDGAVALFDPPTGRRVGPLLTHGGPLAALAFRPDSRELLTVSAEGQSYRWELGGPQSLQPGQWQTWLEAATGVRLDGDALLPLTMAEYRQRLEDARGLPLPRTLAAATAGWHAEEAYRAAQAGQFNSARWHLERWMALEPKAWLPLARRSRLHAREGAAMEAEADLERATALCSDDGLENWRRHQALVDRLTGRPQREAAP